METNEQKLNVAATKVTKAATKTIVKDLQSKSLTDLIALMKKDSSLVAATKAASKGTKEQKYQYKFELLPNKPIDKAASKLRAKIRTKLFSFVNSANYALLCDDVAQFKQIAKEFETFRKETYISQKNEVAAVYSNVTDDAKAASNRKALKTFFDALALLK
jgi:hypothetical protein